MRSVAAPRPADCAVLIENRYCAAAPTIFFIECPAMYNLDQKITMTIFCNINNQATRTRPMVNISEVLKNWVG